MNNEPQISQFSEAISHDDTVIDFKTAVPLGRSGSACDAYVTRHHRRRVFIKRLKEPYRYDAIYRAALEKEFELGVELRHPSLPQYREIHGDYVVMDYVDGFTLAEVLGNESSLGLEIVRRWLSQPENVRKLINNLIQVVAYLHSHNIVHSDVKTDNIMLTKDTHNLVLIDLDKAFTTWLDDTQGRREIYGVGSDAMVTDVDFHGIAIVIGKLRKAGFEFEGMDAVQEKCLSEGARADDILKLLDDNLGNGRNPVLLPLMLIFTLAVGLFVLLYLTSPADDEAAERIGVESESIAPAPVTDQQAPVEVVKAQESSVAKSPSFSWDQPVEESLKSPDAIIQPIYDKLYQSLNELDAYCKSDSLTAAGLLKSITEFSELESSTISRSISLVKNDLALDDDVDAMKAVWNSEVYLRYSFVSDSIQKLIGAEISRKRRLESVNR